MAWQWRRSGVPFQLLSRVGDDRPDVFRAFLDRHGIPSRPGLVAPGRSASIDIVIQPDLQPFMDNFVEGVWASFRLQPDEEALVARRRDGRPPRPRRGRDPRAPAAGGRGRHAGRRGHGRLPRLPPLHRRAAWPTPWPTSTSASWAGRAGSTTRRSRASEASPTIRGKLIVVTFGVAGRARVRRAARRRGRPLRPGRGGAGSRHDARLRGRVHRRVPGVVAARRGTSLAAVERGKALGAEATAWRRPLPDEAYGAEAAIALAAADAAALSSLSARRHVPECAHRGVVFVAA